MADPSSKGNRQGIDEVIRATEIIGRDKIKALLIPVAIFNVVFTRETKNPATIERLREHMLETAVAAQYAARVTGYNDVDEAFMAGFLHDFGRMILLRYFPQEFDEIRRISGDDNLLIDAERDILDTDHQEIGKYIAERWGLPKSFSDVMESHHPDDITDLDSYPQLARLVMFADNISPSGFDFPDNPTGAARRTRVLEKCGANIGFSLKDIKNMYCDLPGDILAVASLFNEKNQDRIEYLSRINRKLFDYCLNLADSIREDRGLSRILPQKRLSGGVQESFGFTLATLSHQINNATMNISGQCEILQMLHDQDDWELIHRKIPATVESVKSSIRKISLILEELSGFNNIENQNNIEKSKVVDVDSELKNRPDPTQVPV